MFYGEPVPAFILDPLNSMIMTHLLHPAGDFFHTFAISINIIQSTLCNSSQAQNSKWVRTDKLFSSKIPSFASANMHTDTVSSCSISQMENLQSL
jgi:hypothetical protein